MIKQTAKSVIFTFMLDSNPHEVLLKASWNGWRAEAMRANDEGLYSKIKRLKPGRYEFGYEIRRVWHYDDTLLAVASPFGSRNSLLEITP